MRRQSEAQGLKLATCFRSTPEGSWSQKRTNPIGYKLRVTVVVAEVSPGEIPVALRAPSISPGP